MFLESEKHKEELNCLSFLKLKVKYFIMSYYFKKLVRCIGREYYFFKVLIEK